MQRVRAAAAELRAVLKSCVNADGEHAAGEAGQASPPSSIEEVCARLQDAVSSMQHSSALGASAQAALAPDVLPAYSQLPAAAGALGATVCSAELPLTLHGQIEALLQLPQSVLDKLPS